MEAIAGAGWRRRFPARSATTRTVAWPARRPLTVSRPISTVKVSGRLAAQTAQAGCGANAFSRIGFGPPPWTSSTRTRSTRPTSSIFTSIGVRLPIPLSFGTSSRPGARPAQNVIAPATSAATSPRPRIRLSQLPPPDRSNAMQRLLSRRAERPAVARGAYRESRAAAKTGRARRRLRDRLPERPRAAGDQDEGDREESGHVLPEVGEARAADDDAARDRDEVGGGEDLGEVAQEGRQRAERKDVAREHDRGQEQHLRDLDRLHLRLRPGGDVEAEREEREQVDDRQAEEE